MTTNKIINTKEEARQFAIGWQAKLSDNSLSYKELADLQAVFNMLAKKFDLTAEFKENGII